MEEEETLPMKPKPPEGTLQRLLARLGAENPVWLHGGRILVGVLGDSILRAGPAGAIAAESEAVAALPKSLLSFAPEPMCAAEEGGWCVRSEAHFGHASPAPKVQLQAWLDAREWERLPVQTRSLRDHLKTLAPHGKLSVSELVRGLRAARDSGETLPFPPRAKHIEQALGQELEVGYRRGWIHGALLARRIRDGGFICWRHARPDGLRGSDVAAHLSPEGQPQDILLHILKWSWRSAPLQAAQCLVALGAVDVDRPGRPFIAAELHPGVHSGDLERIIGCQPGIVSHSVARRAIGRARKLVVGGVPLRVTSTPPVTAKADSSFFLPRGRTGKELFSRHSQGIELDEEGRFSLTPEGEAMALARSLEAEVVVDAFCGCGGNAIAFARMPGIRGVIAIDSDPRRLEMARHNAGLYGVESKIDFICGDAMSCAPEAQVVFVDPPWSLGRERLDDIWDWARDRYPRGVIKLPKEHPVPPKEQISLVLSVEGFPRYMLLGWGGWMPPRGPS
jgi:hypothetical protein